MELLLEIKEDINTIGNSILIVMILMFIYWSLLMFKK